MSDDYVKMREFMDIAGLYATDEDRLEVLHEDVVSFPQTQTTEHPLLPQLKDLVSKLRSHMEEDENQDVAVGVESGMNRAADMIENLLRQHGVNQIG